MGGRGLVHDNGKFVWEDVLCMTWWSRSSAELDVAKEYISKHPDGNIDAEFDSYLKATMRPEKYKDLMEDFHGKYLDYVLDSRCRYWFWCRCEYEIVVHPVVWSDASRKFDVYEQMKANWDVFSRLVLGKQSPFYREEM